jgi:hypothetical protein
VWRETGLRETLPAGGLKICRRAEAGGGFSSPVVANGRAYLVDATGTRADARERVRCFHAADGAVLQSALKPNQKETAVVVALLDALGAVRDKSALDEVNNRVNHLVDEISVAAIRAAGKLGCAKSMDRLLVAWNTIHDYDNPRPAAGGVSAAGQNRTPEKDRRYGMQEPELRTAVAGITGKTSGNVNEARDWWNANRATFREK